MRRFRVLIIGGKVFYFEVIGLCLGEGLEVLRDWNYSVGKNFILVVEGVLDVI